MTPRWRFGLPLSIAVHGALLLTALSFARLAPDAPGLVVDLRATAAGREDGNARGAGAPDRSPTSAAPPSPRADDRPARSAASTPRSTASTASTDATPRATDATPRAADGPVKPTDDATGRHDEPASASTSPDPAPSSPRDPAPSLARDLTSAAAPRDAASPSTAVAGSTESGSLATHGDPSSAGDATGRGDVARAGDDGRSRAGGSGRGEETAAGGGSGPAAGGDRVASLGIPDGGGTSADYAAYYARLRERIQAAVRYPAAARQRGITGTVHLEIALESNGTVGVVSVITSSAHPILDRAAVDAARSVRRVPFPGNAPPPAHRVRLPIVFEFHP